MYSCSTSKKFKQHMNRNSCTCNKLVRIQVTYILKHKIQLSFMLTITKLSHIKIKTKFHALLG